MKKVVRLTESDLVKLVKRIIKEQSNEKYSYEVGKTYEMKRDEEHGGTKHSLKVIQIDKSQTPPSWYVVEISGIKGARELTPNYGVINKKLQKGLHGNNELGAFFEV
jgi:hypothetical protein